VANIVLLALKGLPGLLPAFPTLANLFLKEKNFRFLQELISIQIAVPLTFPKKLYERLEIKACPIFLLNHTPKWLKLSLFKSYH
jgi:hypothetical protein